MEQRKLVDSQFGSRAESYLTSKVHAQGEDLEKLSALAAGARRVLDLGCGAGHASYALARGGAKSVIAYDLSRQMLDVVKKEAMRYPAIEIREGRVEELPFEEGFFDLVVTRYSAHHWLDARRALSEAARVTSKGSRFVAIDTISPEYPLFDTVLQATEILRDASHVRNYRLSEWENMLEEAGFGRIRHETFTVRMSFSSWIERIGTPPERVAALHAAFSAFPEEAKRHFEIGEDCSFTITVGWIEAVRNS